jgi:hypothetical protein
MPLLSFMAAHPPVSDRAHHARRAPPVKAQLAEAEALMTAKLPGMVDD